MIPGCAEVSPLNDLAESSLGVPGMPSLLAFSTGVINGIFVIVEMKPNLRKSHALRARLYTAAKTAFLHLERFIRIDQKDDEVRVVVFRFGGFLRSLVTSPGTKRLRIMRMNGLLFSRMSLMKGLCFSLFCLSIVAVAEAGAIVAPDGLLPGTQFRVIYVTAAKINATSSNISTYDAFVNAQAMNVSYEGYKVHFSAMVSLSSQPAGPVIMNAISHVNDGMSSAASVYTVNGTKIADNTGTTSGGLFSGSVLATPRQGIDGTSYSDVNVWTGSSGNGNAYASGAYGLYALGSLNVGVPLLSPTTPPAFQSPMAAVGRLGSTHIPGYSWLSAGGTNGLVATSTELQLYGISDILTVTEPRLVPEPSCLISLCIGALVLVVPLRLRRRIGGVGQV